MPLAVSCRFEFVDGKGKTSFTKVRVPNGFAIADYRTFAQSMGQFLANVSNAKLTRASICVGLDLSSATIKVAVSGFADIAQKAYFGFTSAVSGLFARLKIPAISETIVAPGSDQIDQSNPDVAAFITAYETGIVTTGGTIQPSDDRENDIVGVNFARELFRKT